MPGFGQTPGSAAAFGQAGQFVTGSIAAVGAGAAAGLGLAAAANASSHDPYNGPPSTPRVCQKCGHSGGNRKFCIQCGAFLGQPGNKSERNQFDTTATNMVPPENPIVMYARQQALPNSATPQSYTMPYPQQVSANQAVPQGYTVPNAQQAPNAPSLPGTIKPPTAFTDQNLAGAPTPRRAPLFDGPLQIAEAAQQAYGAKRQPLTSLNPEVNRFGVPSNNQGPSTGSP
jgi:hypothetical protein